MIRKLLAASLGLLLLALAAAAQEPGPKREPASHLPNGDFEEGDLSPKGWQAVDGLTTFYVRDPDPKRGKVIRFDTDVLQSQAYDWWVQVAGGGSPKDAPRKKPTVAPKYDTLAGLDGVWFWSDPVPVEPGRAYWLTLDTKGPPLLVWLVGYPERPDTSFGADEGAFVEYLKTRKTGEPPSQKRGREPFLHNYVWRGQLATKGSDSWATQSRRSKPFRPTANTPNVRWVRVLIYPYWPPGEYWVDNVRLVPVDEAGPKPGR